MRVALCRLVIPIALAVSLLASTQVAAQAQRATRPTITISISKSQTLSMTSNTRPGLARLHDRSNHSVYLVRSRHGAGLSTFVKDWNAAGSRASVRDFMVVARMRGGSTIVTSLSRGTYFAASGEIGHLKSGQVKRLVVSGIRWNVVRPASLAVRIAASRKMTSPATLYKHRFLHVVNHSRYAQSVEVYGYRATGQQLSDFLAHPTLKGLDQIATSARGLVLLDAHRSVYTNARPPAGQYLIVNFSIHKNSSISFGAGQVHVLTVL